MYTLDELKKQNKEIADLIDVLAILIEQPSLRENPFVCELVSRFNEKVWMHLVFEENTIYSELSKHHNPDISEIAGHFHGSAKNVRKNFTHYVKLWCHSTTDHAMLVDESKKIFQLIRDRISYETNEMFPLAERHFNS
ncbi:MAG: hemerythrin domain-containing protein [Gammaproteobacteria bacterium]|nr:hemerythrin domain-containing protein [Gammaproteobacteria bacterium]